MNPKKEFLNAIMSVLRLEQNIYIIASLEEIIEPIDINDYTMFIGYLGERNTDYEKPIQTIANAVIEFQRKRKLPTYLAVNERIEKMQRVVRIVANNSALKKLDVKSTRELEDVSIFEDELKNVLMKMDDLEQDWFDKYTTKIIVNNEDDTEKVNVSLIKEYGLSFKDIYNGFFSSKISSKILKPSITEKIEKISRGEASEKTGITDKRVAGMLANLQYTTE